MDLVDKFSPKDIVKALNFADEAARSLQAKVAEQHNTAVRELPEKIGMDVAKAATVVDYPNKFQTEVIWDDAMKVTFHTRQEVFEDSVKFVTGASLEMDGEVHHMKLSAFNVRKG